MQNHIKSNNENNLCFHITWYITKISSNLYFCTQLSLHGLLSKKRGFSVGAYSRGAADIFDAVT